MKNKNNDKNNMNKNCNNSNNHKSNKDHNKKDKGTFKYYISTFGGDQKCFFVYVARGGGLEAKCVFKVSEFLSIRKRHLSLQNLTSVFCYSTYMENLLI